MYKVYLVQKSGGVHKTIPVGGARGEFKDLAKAGRYVHMLYKKDLLQWNWNAAESDLSLKDYIEDLTASRIGYVISDTNDGSTWIVDWEGEVLWLWSQDEDLAE